MGDGRDYCWVEKTFTFEITPDKAKTKRKQKENDMTKLYEINTKKGVLYGYKLATNSSGQWVMEVKGSGEILAVGRKDVAEVLPYTIGVQFEEGKRVYSYMSEPGAIEKGAFYIYDAPQGRAIVQVVAIDTKSTSATKVFEPLAKLVTA